MRRILLLLLLLATVLKGQPYLSKEGKTRHRFAQTVFGVEMRSSLGGASSFINQSGEKENFAMQPSVNPQLYFSGTHFWGHAEFYFSLPLSLPRKNSSSLVRYHFSQSDIFGAKIYPLAIKKKRIRPYVGFAIAGFNYQQHYLADGSGVAVQRLRAPLLAGINYCGGKYHVEIGFSWNYRHSIAYYISSSRKENIQLPPFQVSIVVKRWMETTLSAEKNYRNGKTDSVFGFLNNNGKLSSWFLGIGPSSAFFTSRSPYNAIYFPYFEKPFATVFPELSFGYFYQPCAIHFAGAVRINSSRKTAYAVTQNYTRASFAIESFKYLFDYNGFTPYLGLSISYEQLAFYQTSKSHPTMRLTKQCVAPGVLFGWDILPDKLQWFTLRTNLRYFPNLRIEAQNGHKIFFDQLEFNFIQFIYYPARARIIKKSAL